MGILVYYYKVKYVWVQSLLVDVVLYAQILVLNVGDVEEVAKILITKHMLNY